MGFTQVGLPYDRAVRTSGESKFSLGDLLGLALDGILNHSVVPLRLATYAGLAVFPPHRRRDGLVRDRPLRLRPGLAPGFATTTSSCSFSISLNALFLGIIGEYSAGSTSR